ncbi:hypothetical protein RCL_jg7452.t1 [Rhizophagus clarus]|uniref:Uncharacterized protein n=1 Tax=Rhizophagus clarus TaxID=94130 RepID=A0A8H3QF24_9GLOM|nr:hypothetical protein RCL_jg7452.t1 [Rhizophagus clarus]
MISQEAKNFVILRSIRASVLQSRSSEKVLIFPVKLFSNLLRKMACRSSVNFPLIFKARRDRIPFKNTNNII